MQTIGERLEEARKRKGVSLREAAEATKIRGDYLQKLEANQLDLGLSPIYLRGFIRGYAHYLGLSAEKLVNDFDDLNPDSARAGCSANREIYGRMEFGPAETTRAEPPAAGTTPSAAAHKPAPRASRPPKHLGKFPVTESSSERGLLLHLLKLVGGGVLAIALVVWVVLWSVSSKPKPTPVPAAPEHAAVKPAPAELAPLKIYAKGPVKITLRQKSDSTVLIDATLRANETREVPRRGAIQITVDTPANVDFETVYAGKLIRFPASNGELPGE